MYVYLRDLGCRVQGFRAWDLFGVRGLGIETFLDSRSGFRARVYGFAFRDLCLLGFRLFRLAACFWRTICRDYLRLFRVR